MVLIALISANRIAGQNRKGLTEQEKRGKQIYVKGESAAGEITARLGSDELEVPGSSFSCLNCHGHRGIGTSEGGVQPPAIDRATLISPNRSALTGRLRAAYNDATLARSISHALDPAGRRLQAGMPSYQMSSNQMADLIAYLKQLGTESETEQGVTAETIKIGAALPLTGPLMQAGADVKAALEASFAAANAQGGIYNRRFELVVEDSRGDAAQMLAATRKLIEQDGVFALIGSFESGDSSALNQLIRSKEVPLIGPITLSPRLQTPPNPYVFYLLPTFADQARTLVDFAGGRAKGQRVRLGVVYSTNGFDQDAVAGLRAQAKMYPMQIVSDQNYQVGTFQAAQTVELLAQQKPDYIFFFGAAHDGKALAQELDRVKMNVPLLSTVVMLGREAFALPASVAGQTFLAYPSALPNQQDFGEFLTTMRDAKVEVRSPAFQSVAYAATKLFVEATKLSGRLLDRRSLITALEGIREFKTGVIPPLTFGPKRRVGAVGSYVVGIDLSKQQYVPLTNRLDPKEKP